MSKLSTVEECVFDMNFESTAVAENFLSIVAKMDDFEDIIKLPLHQIPEAIRKNDPNLKSQPMYEIRSKTNLDYKIMLGDNLIGLSLVSADRYTSWKDSFFPKIQELFSIVLDSGKINKINRIGLRYVDFLEGDNVFQSGKIAVDINGNNTNDKKMFLRIEDNISGVSYTKAVTNNVQYKAYPNRGSIIDIVTFIEGKDSIVNDDFEINTLFGEIDSLHAVHTDKFKEVVSDERIEAYGI